MITDKANSVRWSQSASFDLHFKLTCTRIMVNSDRLWITMDRGTAKSICIKANLE